MSVASTLCMTKRIGAPVISLVLVTLSAVTLATAVAALGDRGTKNVPWVVGRIQGRVELETGKNKSVLTAETPAPAAAVVRVDKEARAQLISRQTRVSMGSSSVVRIEGSKVVLITGTIFVEGRPESEKRTLVFPGGSVVWSDGEGFVILDSSRSDGTQVATLSGTLLVRAEKGEPIVLRPGKQVEIQQGRIDFSPKTVGVDELKIKRKNLGF